jgi:hypothetical protein
VHLLGEPGPGARPARSVAAANLAHRQPPRGAARSRSGGRKIAETVRRPPTARAETGCCTTSSPMSPCSRRPTGTSYESGSAGTPAPQTRSPSTPAPPNAAHAACGDGDPQYAITRSSLRPCGGIGVTSSAIRRSHEPTGLGGFGHGFAAEPGTVMPMTNRGASTMTEAPLY